MFYLGNRFGQTKTTGSAGTGFRPRDAVAEPPDSAKLELPTPPLNSRWFCMSLQQTVSNQLLCELLDGWRSGDLKSRDRLFTLIRTCVERLIQRLFFNYKAMRRHIDESDVYQEVMMRQLVSLPETNPRTTRDLLNLVSTDINREIIDQYRRQNAKKRKSEEPPPNPNSDSSNQPDLDPSDYPTDAADLERWTRFHAAVGQLPDHLKETFNFKFYHGWDHEQIATMFNRSVRQIGRWLKEAHDLLNTMLGGDMPPISKT
jgi:RNA polymerase sigma factor (sigma-70 family)